MALDSIIEKECSDKNSKLVEEYVASLTEKGRFSQTGMWKLRKKLHPQQVDPPMAKFDKNGNVITATPLLRKPYLDTYVERLRHRDIQPEYEELHEMKTTLWNYRLDMLKSVKSNDWQNARF